LTANTITVNVRANDTATIACPACETIKHISTQQFRYARHTITVRCQCQHSFTVLLNFRRFYRKQTSLTGTYAPTGKGGAGGGFIHVNNLSRNGIGFTVSGMHQIEKGQEIQLEFQLNDKKKTTLKKRAVVRSVRQNAIGCEFLGSGELDKDLGFFLQP
jgi:hypothetical protein